MGGGELSTTGVRGVILQNIAVGEGSSVHLVSTREEAVEGTNIAVGDGQEVHLIRHDGPLVVKNMKWTGSDHIVPLPSSVKAEIEEEPCRAELNENRGSESVVLRNENVDTGAEALNAKTGLSLVMEDSLKAVETEKCSLNSYVGYLQSQLDKSQIRHLNMGDFQLHSLVEEQKK
ncbi:hypothetical protein V496_01380 [Pseudogymnoascus sp. VKM F-4515 (FW-2607)]|nr:hypothetical protein V496_01380 [Pseudogymnoascus sp. VKM F-4515 (FW-2607)]